MSGMQLLDDVTDRIDSQLPRGIQGKLKFLRVPAQPDDDSVVLFQIGQAFWALKLSGNLQISDVDVARLCVML
jgi:hypothetical protein